MPAANLTQSDTIDSAPVRAIVAMVHVAGVERSVEFYRLLGFEVGNRVPPSGPAHWVWLYAPRVSDWKIGPNLMLTRTERAIDPEAQHILFYLYATNLVALRDTLIAAGLQPSEITYPEYLPNGEFSLRDPDGYLLMIAQSAHDTP